mmetsp:Transcript_121231/g.354374  ORF Transcript_121231/g.354374 Transcript_121231/m.354374 type:complete len:223 (-) Transcript_121231:588-1256(-)
MVLEGVKLLCERKPDIGQKSLESVPSLRVLQLAGDRIQGLQGCGFVVACINHVVFGEDGDVSKVVIVPQDVHEEGILLRAHVLHWDAAWVRGIALAVEVQACARQLCKLWLDPVQGGIVGCHDEVYGLLGQRLLGVHGRRDLLCAAASHLVQGNHGLLCVAPLGKQRRPAPLNVVACDFAAAPPAVFHLAHEPFVQAQRDAADAVCAHRKSVTQGGGRAVDV